MADVLGNAIRDTGRVPNMVLTGHVHNYQRIDQSIAPNVPTPFIVTGNGGYHNLHKMHSNVGDKAADTDAVLKYFTQTCWGFMTLTIDKDTISGVTTEIDRDGIRMARPQYSNSSVTPMMAAFIRPLIALSAMKRTARQARVPDPVPQIAIKF